MICFHQRRSRQPKRPGAVGRSIQEKGFLRSNIFVPRKGPLPSQNLFRRPIRCGIRKSGHLPRFIAPTLAENGIENDNALLVWFLRIAVFFQKKRQSFKLSAPSLM
jgi:hypothetical protein